MCVKMWTCTADTDGERASKCNFVIFCVLDAGDLDLYQVLRYRSFQYYFVGFRFELCTFGIFPGGGEEGVHYERFGECYVK